MLHAASKYSPVRPPQGSAGPTTPPARGCESARRAASLPPVARGHRVPILRRPLTPGEVVDAVADKLDQERADALRARGVTIYIPRFRKSLSLGDWKWRELREGGLLKEYLAREKHGTTRRWRGVGRARQDFQQNPKSDLRLKASIPARDFFRFKRMDPDFFDDDANLRSLRRDNPEIDTIYV